jgi:crotonobetainyl-CoA:carnitine CoA-transferase CaiB-like acyl-CoA transferase
MLSSLKVLDLTRVLAGPLCSMMLGDLGADVLKVERPGAGDDTRGWGPPFDADGRSAYYLSVNRNKLGIAADFDSEADRALLSQLVREADVVIDNFRPGMLARRGFSPDEWCARRPELIWCTISGFGPGSDRPGYDFVTQAEAGWMAITGEPDGDPMKAGLPLADILAGKDAAIAILGALFRRGRTGDGARIQISLADSARAALVNVAQNVLVSGRDAARWGNAHPNLVPYELFNANDRPLLIAVGNDAQFVACARAVGLDALASDPTLATNAGRLAQRERVVSAFAQRLATQPAAYWRAKLDAVAVPNGIVRSVLEALQDSGASPLTGMPSSIGGRVRFAPPALDEHGQIVRREGWNAFKSVGSQTK